MGKLLFDESPLVIQPSLAKAIGLNEAIVLQQIHYWLQGNKSGKEIEGVRWIYNSLAEWKEQFPFWSESTIYRALQSLEEKKLIQIGEFNQRKYDRTKWYTINYVTVLKVEEGGWNSNFHNETSSCQDGTTIPETSTQTSSVVGVSPTPPNETTDFEKVWNEVEQCFIMLNPSDFQKLRELWEKFPDFQRHNYAIDRARKANPKQFRFYLKDFASFDPTIPRTWGGDLIPSAVASGTVPLATAPPMHPMALRGHAKGKETVGQTLERLLQQGTIKEEMYHASCQRYSEQLHTPTDAIPLPHG